MIEIFFDTSIYFIRLIRRHFFRLDLYPDVCEAVLKYHFFSLTTHRPVNRIEIWEKMKILCVNRLTSGIYSVSILVLYLKVLLNMIGGVMYTINVNQPNTAAKPVSIRRIQKRNETSKQNIV
jgi:hypothetical protein